jgi:hypothetical protein
VGPCHHGMARPQVADGEDGLQIWGGGVAANISNKQLRTTDKWQSSILSVSENGENLFVICSIH